MSTFEDENYRWRETYFVLFDAKKRPPLARVKKVLAGLSDRYELTNLSADEAGLCESLTLHSPDDFAALDVCYVGGDEVREQVEQMVAEIKPQIVEPADKVRLQRIAAADGRFDVLHFEQLTEGDADEEDELLDPSAVLIVLAALARLTDGVAVDPQSGTFL